MFKRIQWLMEDPGRIKRAIQRRMPGIISAGPRAVAKKVSYQGLELFRKEYTTTEQGVDCIGREKLARKVFAGKSWIIPIREQGNDWIGLPYLPEDTRLDRVAPGLDEGVRIKIAAEALSIILDIYCAGYFHGDFHTHNLFWFQGQLLVGDFEKMTAYPDGRRPVFRKCFDLTGDSMGLEIPGTPGTSPFYYGATTGNKSLEFILGVPLEKAMEGLGDYLKNELREVCLAFQSLDDRHWIRAQKIYSSIALPYLKVPAEEAQRDCAKRIAKLGISRETLGGKSLLDLGCNIGGMIFASQQFSPASSLGVEYDADKVVTATRVAAYNDLQNTVFMNANVDEMTSADLDGPYDVVYCFALVMHVQKPDRLYRLLGEVTKHTLYFEGNRATSREEIEASLRANGFKEIESLGDCDDDCMQDNNNRPLYIARK